MEGDLSAERQIFPDLEVIGWALSRMGFSVRLNDKIKKTHFENFPGEGKVLYMVDHLEQEDAFMYTEVRIWLGRTGTIYIMKEIL